MILVGNIIKSCVGFIMGIVSTVTVSTRHKDNFTAKLAFKKQTSSDWFPLLTVTARGIRVGRSKGRKMMEDIKRILVMSRSTTDCKKAVHYGISLARTHKAQLYILHVIHEPFGLRNVPFISSLRFLEEEFQAMLQKVKSDLDMLIQKERTRGISIKEMVKEAEPVDEIVKIVQEEKIDLLLVAAHDETRIEHIIYGRINHEIVRRLPCSVFLVKG